MTFSDVDIDLKKELKKCKSMEDLIGKNGLLQRLIGGMVEEILQREMDHTLSMRNTLLKDRTNIPNPSEV